MKKRRHTVVITASVLPSLDERLRQQAKAEERKKSQIVARALTLYFDHNPIEKESDA